MLCDYKSQLEAKGIALKGDMAEALNVRRASVARLSMRSARNTVGTKGTPE